MRLFPRTKSCIRQGPSVGMKLILRQKMDETLGVYKKERYFRIGSNPLCGPTVLGIWICPRILPTILPLILSTNNSAALFLKRAQASFSEHSAKVYIRIHIVFSGLTIGYIFGSWDFPINHCFDKTTKHSSMCILWLEQLALVLYPVSWWL